jgi:hypothetical protein
MKKTLLALCFLVTILFCCEKDEDGFTRSSFLIVGDCLNCEHTDYDPDLHYCSWVDSLDIDRDYKKDLLFSRDSVFIDDCEEFLANCPPNVICDCFPTLYTDYNIELANDSELAIDNDSTIHEYAIHDTVSNKNQWSKNTKYPLYHRSISDPFWTGSKEYFIGIRILQNRDTLYSWINIEINDSGFVIKEMAIQK